jgi:hypothetical protein
MNWRAREDAVKGNEGVVVQRFMVYIQGLKQRF